MCGIWALLSQIRLVDTQITNLFKAFIKIKNRGPNFSSFDLIGNDNKLILGFHRLAIMDISAKGNQPFYYVRDDGSCVYCVCNGEIYDYKKLKEKYGIVQKSNSDCEVIIPLYEKLGVDKMIKLLGSEFAFVIFDISKECNVKMIIGNDPIGVRPVFYAEDDTSLCVSSELKGLSDVYQKCYRFPPGHYMCYENGAKKMTQYYSYMYNELNPVPDIDVIYDEIRKRLINSVRCRMMSDRPFGALLSGGLDSSLICGIIKWLIDNEFTELKEKKIPVFTLGLKSGSTDVPFAKQVAEYLGFEHHVVEINEQDALKEIDETIECTSSWDITTNRASVMNKIICKYISENTDVKCIFTGELSDEIFNGYLYSHYAPSAIACREDAIRLVKNVHAFDGLRADRVAATYGLEVRLPFSQIDLIDYVFSLPAELTTPMNGLEKSLLRNAFKDMKIIPESILIRTKNAFSDAVSLKERSWYQIIQEYIDLKVSDEEFQTRKDKFKYYSPFTKESYYYRKKFVEYIGESEEKAKTIPYFWMPKWSDAETCDPSARTLKVYKE